MGRGRIARACVFCRNNKTKCHIPAGQKTCEKCAQMGLECSLLTKPAAPLAPSHPGVTKPERNPQYKTRLDQLQNQMEHMMQIMRSQGVNDLVLLSLPDGRPSLQPPPQPQSALNAPAQPQAPVSPIGPGSVQSMSSDGSLTLTQSLQRNHNGFSLPPLNYRVNPAVQAPHYPVPLWKDPVVAPAPPALLEANFVNQQGFDYDNEPYRQPWYATGAMASQYNMFGNVNTGLFFQASPANFLSQVLKPSYLVQVYRELITPVHRGGRDRRDPHRTNVITEKILTREQAIDLLTHFRDNFNHWINLPAEMPAEDLVEYLCAESSLMLTVCCTVALRFDRKDLRAKVYEPLLKHLHLETMRARMHLRQNVEFLQAMVILANFSESLCSPYCLYDPWFVSSWGIQHLTNLMSITDESSLQMHRLWNHLAIAHLYTCNSTGRRCILSADSIRASQEILKIPQSNQFDACILAEISAQFAAYRFFNSHISNDAVEDELLQWEEEWSFLTTEEQTIQFASGVHTYIRFMVRLHQLLREAKSGSHATPSGVNTVVLAFQSAPLAELFEQIDHLASVPSLLLERVSVDMFACLGDQLQQLGLLCCTLALQLCSLARESQLLSAQQASLSQALALVDGLADRFEAVSQSPDDLHAVSAAALRDFKTRLNL